MDRERLEALIQAQLDGELPAAERAELARTLLQDAGARRLHDAFAQTDRLLREIPAADPPAGLREAILAGTARGAAAAGGAGRPARHAAYRMAATFLGGLLIVGLVYLVNDGRGPDDDLQGSLAAAGRTVSLQSEGVTVEATLRRDGDQSRLEIHATAPKSCEVVVTFDPAATTFAGKPDAAASASEGRVTVPLPRGRRVATLEFSGGAPLAIELRDGGRSLGEARFPVNAP